MYIYIYIHTVDTIDEFVNLYKPTHITGGGISWDFSRWFPTEAMSSFHPNFDRDLVIQFLA